MGFDSASGRAQRMLHVQHFVEEHVFDGEARQRAAESAARGQIGDRRQGFRWTRDADKCATGEWPRPIPGPPRAPRARHPKGVRKRFLLAGVWCASNWRKDKILLQSAADAPGNPNVYKLVGRSRRLRKRGWDVRVRVSLRSAAHRRRSILFDGLRRISDSVFG